MIATPFILILTQLLFFTLFLNFICEYFIGFRKLIEQFESIYNSKKIAFREKNYFLFFTNKDFGDKI